MSDGFEDEMKVKKELEDEERKNLKEEGVGVDGREGRGRYGLIGGELVSR